MVIYILELEVIFQGDFIEWEEKQVRDGIVDNSSVWLLEKEEENILG